MTWPDFVVFDGETKLAIELKTPRTGVAGGQGMPFTAGPLMGKTVNLQMNGAPTTLRVGTNLGFTAACLLQYALDIDREARGRKANMPVDYVNVLLIDLSITNEAPVAVAADLARLRGQQSVQGEGIYVYSAEWWTTYYAGPFYFVNGTITDGAGTDMRSRRMLTYDEIASVFRMTTTCTRCRSHVPTEHRNRADLCRPCYAYTNGFCARCGTNGPPICGACHWVVAAAQMICTSHPKTPAQQQTINLCEPCMLAALPAAVFHPVLF